MPLQSTREEQIAGVIAEVLNRPQVGREDDFFAINGPSLPARRQLAARLALRLGEVLGLKVPLAALLAHPTAAGLAAWIGSARLGASAPPIERAAPHRETPLSYGQQRLWFLAQLEPGATAYNVPVVLELEGPLDASALQVSLHAIERRHEILRTTFRVRDGQPFQWVAACEGAALPVIDLSMLPQELCERVAEELAAEEHRRPFDLETGPLWRSLLLRLDGGRHRLVQTLHHIICDGWSIEVLLREIGAHYRAFASGGTEPVLPALPIQYGDYALWQHRHFDREALSGPLEAWKRRLAGHLSVLELAVDPAPPESRSAAGASVSIEVPGRLLEAVKECSRLQGATQFMALLGVFQILLSRYTGRSELVVGTPVANRSRAELTELIGFFANTLVLPARISPAASFRELLGHVREVMVAALQSQDLPLQMLVQELALERNRQPFLQTMFTYHSAPTAVPAVPGLALRLLDSASGGAMFDLSLAVVESKQRLRVFLEYSTELFSRTAAHRLLEHFGTLLEGAVTDPEQRIDELPLLTEAERHQLLIANSDTSAQEPAACLHALFAAQAVRSPQATAVVAAGEHLTYAELAALAREIAQQLRALGLGPESTVGVCMRRSPGLLAAILGVLEAGAAYVPLDPVYPPERLTFMLADSGAAVVLADAASLPRLPRGVARVVQLPLGSAQAGGGRSAPPSPAGPGNLAYVIYTSGSTGRPKGVAIEHASAAAFVRWAGEIFGAELAAGVLASTSICFDLSIFEIFATLCHGGRVILVENALELALQPEIDEIDEIGMINTVPSILAELLRQGALPLSVRTVNLAGEALPGPLVRQIHDGTSVERVFNLYGPSEDTTYSLFAQVGRGEAAPPIGRPVTGARARVLGPQGELLPAGVPGELLLGGSGLARGYLGRPDLTAERFVPDPWGPEPGSRLYRTGDLVRFRWDGELEFLGRIDHQVKVRGFRIELGEVEATLSALPEVVAAVAGVRGGQDGQRLVAWVVPASGTIDAGQLQAALAARLPGYMVPSAWMVLGELPRTPNGKVDRAALPEPCAMGPETHGGEPRTPVEEIVAAIYAELLGVPGVGRSDSFFDLGGHSLLATRIVSRLRSIFGVELPVRSLFERPSVAELSAAVEEARRRQAGRPALPLVPVPRTGDLPLSFSQERLWFLHQLAPESAELNIVAAVRLEGLTDATALEAALGEIERRHEILRTTFPVRDNLPVQVIAPAAARHLPRVDLSGLPAARRETECDRLAREEARTPFDLARGPVWRTALIRLDTADHALFLVLHHIAGDAWSLGILVRELGALYAAFSKGLPARLPKLPVQFADFAAWQRELDGEGLAPDLAYWREHLAGAPALVLPPDLHHRPEQPVQPAYLPAGVDPELTGGLAALARATSTTLFMAVLAGFQAVLALHTGRYDQVAGSNVANRHHLETEGLIGCFINVLVLRTDLSGDPTFEELLRRVREVTLEALAHQDLPFDRLVQELEPSRTAGRAPLFQIKVDLLPAIQPVELSELRLRLIDAGRTVARYDLHLSLREEDGRLRGGFLYDSGRFAAATVSRLGTRFVRLLAEAVRTPGAHLSELEQRLDAAEAAEEQERRRELGRTNLASLRQIRRRPLPGATPDVSEITET